MVATARTLAVAAPLVGSVVGAGLALTVVAPAPADTANGSTNDPAPATVSFPAPTLSAENASVEQFRNRTAFESYVAAGQRLADASPNRRVTAAVGTPGPTAETAVTLDSGAPTATNAPSRIAETNVQVGGVDEPDIVKTDGRNFYCAPAQRYARWTQPDRQRTATAEKPPERERPSTHVIDASDPDAPTVVSHINTTGKLLQTGDRLVVFEHERVVGYDVADPQNPIEVWSQPLNGTFVTARKANGTVYLVTESSVGPDTPCPIRPLGPDHAVACTDIYRPGTQISADATYSAFSIDADAGTVADSVSFVGTAHNAVVYMSPDALYVTYTQRADRAEVVTAYVEQLDRAPQSLRDRIAELQSYDISTVSKLREMRAAVEGWLRSLPAEKRQAVQQEYREGLGAYLGEHKRDLTRTGVVRVDVTGDSLSVESTGVVPGTPLNQFALDHRDGTLRIATTIPRTGDGESENDLYALDAETLDRQGSVTGMGDDQRVYSVRYVGNSLYAFAGSSVTVVDQTTWTETTTLHLDD